MVLERIAEKHKESIRTIRAYLAVFNLPIKYQELVWNKKIGIGIIEEISSLLNGKNVSTYTQVTDILDRTITDKHFGLMQVREELKKQNGKFQEKAKTIIKINEPDIKIETPEEYEKAAEALKREAKKKREASLTKDEKEKREIEKQQKLEERKLRERKAREEKICEVKKKF